MGDHFVVEIWLAGRDNPIRFETSLAECRETVGAILEDPEATGRVFPEERPTDEELEDRLGLRLAFSRSYAEKWLAPSASDGALVPWQGADAFTIRSSAIDHVVVIDPDELPPRRRRAVGFQPSPTGAMGPTGHSTTSAP